MTGKIAAGHGARFQRKQVVSERGGRRVFCGKRRGQMMGLLLRFASERVFFLARRLRRLLSPARPVIIIFFSAAHGDW